MKTLTVFTPAFNRAHTLVRTYKSLCRQTCQDFCWLVVDDGSTDNTRQLVEGWIEEGRIPVRYIYKENGGLHTAYNTAYANIDTELNMCVDSDDFLPDDAVDVILKEWRERGSENYAGLIGLDYSLDNQPIGGPFPETLTETHVFDLRARKIHDYDCKPVYRSDLTRKFSPMIGFPGEKNFNPHYIAIEIDRYLPVLVVNKNFCFVDYQVGDSMSRNIVNQYFNSPRSFCKSRIQEMSHPRTFLCNNIRLATHYVAESIIARNAGFLRESPCKLLTLLCVPAGVALYFYLLTKRRK